MEPALPAKVLLLGSTGFFGRGVAHRLLDGGYGLRCLVRDPLKAAAFKVRGAEIVIGDATNPASLNSACQGMDHAVSLVAVRRNEPQPFTEVNIDAPRYLAEACRARGVKSIVFVSAIGARPDPQYRYLISRWMGEEELKKGGVPCVILRFSMVIAEQGGFVDSFERAAKFGPVMVVPGGGTTRYQPILREDAARCVVEAISRPNLLGHTIELGGPEVLTYEQIFEAFCQARRLKKRRMKLPTAALMPGAAVMEMIFKDPIVTTDELRTLAVDNLADGLDSVGVHFGFRPTAPSGWIAENWKTVRSR